MTVITFLKLILSASFLESRRKASPYDVQAEHCSSVLELAHNASLNSRLGVGVGISKEGIVLQHEKLDKAAPLFKIKLYQTELFRKIGANAARLVKKMPFKVLD